MVKEKKILVLGDVILDNYWFGRAEKISPEAPVPVVQIDNSKSLPGGAANVANNLINLGIKVSLFGIIGRDKSGSELEEILKKKNIDINFIYSKNQTINKIRVISKSQQMIRLDFETKYEKKDAVLLLKSVLPKIKDFDLVIISDYNKGSVLPEKVIAQSNKYNIPSIVDPKGNSFIKYKGSSYITPNMNEITSIIGHVKKEEDLISSSMKIIKDLSLQGLIITRSELGVTLVEKSGFNVHLPATAKEVSDVTGAGDTFISIFSSAIASGLNGYQAADLANKAAGIVVSKLGTATVSKKDLLNFKNKNSIVFSNLEILDNWIKKQKKLNKRIVFSNGCFDIIHSGHIDYLRKASRLGDKFILAINSDVSIKKLKGEERPYNNINKRLSILKRLGFIDGIIVFEENTPLQILKTIEPNVVVKGGDYKNISEVVGHEIVTKYGGEIKLIKKTINVSTTDILKIIK